MSREQGQGYQGRGKKGKFARAHQRIRFREPGGGDVRKKKTHGVKPEAHRLSQKKNGEEI